MNADEIVKVLRGWARLGQHHERAKCEYDAADLIESQAAEIARHNAAVTAEGFADVQTMIARYKQVMYDANEISISQDEEIEELRERLTALRDAQTTHYCVNCEDVARQLAESQRRERAAVEDLSGYCFSCAFVKDCAKHDDNCTAPVAWYYGDCDDWQWRGPGAGEGAEK